MLEEFGKGLFFAIIKDHNRGVFPNDLIFSYPSNVVGIRFQVFGLGRGR